MKASIGVAAIAVIVLIASALTLVAAGGTAFVFLQELPPANDLARAALMKGWSPLGNELARLDQVDDVDLGVAMEHDE